MKAQKFRKIISLIMTVCIVFTMFAVVPFSAFAEVTSGTTGDCTWTLDGTHLTISGNGEMEDYCNERNYWDTPWGTEITSVDIKQGVTNIGGFAFSDCASLISITIPDSVTSIGIFAFSDCASLISITIPDNVTSISEEAFQGCTSLTSITIPDSVTGIDGYVFCDTAYYNNEANWENGVLYIGNHLIEVNSEIVKGDYVIRTGTKCIAGNAFGWYTGLTSIIIPNSVTSIGDSAFSSCTGLTAIIVNENNKNYCSVDGVLYNNDKSELIYCPLGKTGKLTIPDGTTRIEDGKFAGCTGLTSVSIPDSVTDIGTVAFSGCTSLTNITIPDGVTEIGGSAFYNTAYYNNEDNWENGVLYIGNHLIDANREIVKGDYVIHTGTKCIAGGAFYDCSSLTSITIPDSVTSIGGSAFSGCTGLTSITIPDSVTSIESYAFRECTGLTSIIIPDSVTSIGWRAFENCTGLTSIIIPDSVTSIGEGAFSGCTGLTNITIPNSVTSIGLFAFSDCTSLTSITIPDSVTSIESYAFRGCTGLTAIIVSENNKNYCSVDGVLYTKDKSQLILCLAKTTGKFTIPDSVTSIDGYAFSGCTGLTSITIPDSVTSIGDSAFSNCTGLTSITIPDSVTSIVWWAFKNCTNLTSITIPGSVTSIESSAFQGCTGLTSITIPDSVISIGWEAFDGCKDLVITTVENSAAHKYAVDNNIKFKLAKSTSVKGTDGISVEGNEISLPEAGASLSVKRADSEAEKLQSKLKFYGAEKAVGYDISLQKDGTTVQPNGKVKVNIAVPDGMNGAKCKVLRVEADGSLTDMDDKFENGVLSFETEHFSLYIIAETADDIFADANGDGVINLDDAILAAEAAVGSVQTEELIKKADVNGDGKVTIHDALLIARFISGVIDKLPTAK